AGESSDATGVDGDWSNDDAEGSGAVYVFTRAGVQWSQQAYVKASNTGAFDGFGFTVGLSTDGNTLAVGTPFEDSTGIGVGGDQNVDGTQNSGAVYVFTRAGVQ